MNWKRMFHYPITPGGIGVNIWDVEEFHVREVILRNTEARHLGISEMNLIVTGLSAVDAQGREQCLLHTERPVYLDLPSMSTGRFIRGRNFRPIVPGNYPTLRFYIDEGSVYATRDWKIHGFTKREYIDFEVENGLEIQSERSPELFMRFVFPGFQRTQVLGYLRHTLRKWIAGLPDLSLRPGKLSNERG